MEKQQHFTHFSSAKGQIGLFRSVANAAGKSACGTTKSALRGQIAALIGTLEGSLPFLRSVGMATETMAMITVYTTFLCRVDSS